MSRWSFCPLLLATLLACSPPSDGPPSDSPPSDRAPSEPAGSRKPSILLIDIDTLRADHLSGYGYARKTSPNLDALMESGVRFARAFSQAPNTLPSQTSILTSLYPSTHGSIRDQRVPESAVTLAEVLAEEGYSTAAFVGGGYMSERFGHDQGFERYEVVRAGFKEIVPRAVAWLESRQKQEPSEPQQPFFLLLHTYDVHTPYDPPEPWRSMFLEGLPEPSKGFAPTAKRLEEIRRSKSSPNRILLAENDLEHIRALYDGGIRHADYWVGELLERIGPLAERVIVVLVSDHGEEFQEHGSLMHDRLYPTVTHIPFAIRLPGTGAGRTVTQTVEAIDLMPTLLELAGAKIPAAVQGRSLVRLLRGDTLPSRAAFGESPFWGGRRSVVADDHQLVVSLRPDDEIGRIVGVAAAELFDLAVDPHAIHDVLEERPAVREALAVELGTRLEAIRARGEPGSAARAELDERTRERLRALGYAEQ